LWILLVAASRVYLGMHTVLVSMIECMIEY